MFAGDAARQRSPPRFAQATARMSSVSNATIAATRYISGCITCRWPPGSLLMYSPSQISFGCWRRSSFVSANSSCSAIWAVTPGASRAHMRTVPVVVSVKRFAAFNEIRLLLIGSQMSGVCPPRLANAKGVMPITVACLPFKWIVLPMIDGSPPKRRSQNS